MSENRREYQKAIDYLSDQIRAGMLTVSPACLPSVPLRRIWASAATLRERLCAPWRTWG